jgi:Ca2+-binding RTX toxin-like protein
MYGGPGRDYLQGGLLNTNRTTPSGRDRIYGGHGGDILVGDGGDWLYGGRGTDSLATYLRAVAPGAVLLVGGPGNDSLDAKDGIGDDTLRGSRGVDTCRADPGDSVRGCP